MNDLSTDSESYQNSWLSWFLSTKGNEYFCEVDEEFILDRFNLTGLNADVQCYSQALELITDALAEDDLDDDARLSIENSARYLYGLIHARFITTSRGQSKMLEKFKKADFGRCPRVLCGSQPLLPVGLSDVPYLKAVKLYCARCEDIYSPKSSKHATIDGAYFGTIFPHMLFMVYPHVMPSKQPGLSTVGSTAAAAANVERYRPSMFGFQVHETAKWARWQEAVRNEQIQRLEAIEKTDSSALTVVGISN